MRTGIKKEKKLPEETLGFAFRWSTGAISINAAALFISYINYYGTDVVGMDVGLVGILILASKIFDGITDIIAGFLVDRTNTKWGKARPYNLFIIFVWIGMICLFSMPDMSSTWKAIYLFTGYTLITSVFNTMFLASEPVYFKRATCTEKGRTKVMSISSAVGALFIIIFSIVLPMLIKAANDTMEGWTKLAVMFSVPMLALGLIRVLTIKEIDGKESAKEHADSLHIKEELRILFKNKYIFLIGLVSLLSIMVNAMSSVNAYYFTYIVGDLDMASVVGIVAVITPVVVALIPKLSDWIGLKRVVEMGFIIGALSGVIRIFAGNNMVLLIIANLLFSVSLVPMAPLLNLFTLDCMDYSEWKDGKKIDGIVASVTSFFNKIGNALAAGMIGGVMRVGGYNGTLTVQTESALHSIVFLYAGVPLIFSLIALILMHTYDLDHKMPDIRRELKIRNR